VTAQIAAPARWGEDAFVIVIEEERHVCELLHASAKNDQREKERMLRAWALGRASFCAAGLSRRRHSSCKLEEGTAIFDAAMVTLTAIRPMYIPRPLVDLPTPITDMAWCMGLSRCRRLRGNKLLRL
jgi:hypothetical protein